MQQRLESLVGCEGQLWPDCGRPSKRSHPNLFLLELRPNLRTIAPSAFLRKIGRFEHPPARGPMVLAAARGPGPPWPGALGYRLNLVASIRVAARSHVSMSVRCTQRLQDPLIKEYSLNHIGNPINL